MWYSMHRTKTQEVRTLTQPASQVSRAGSVLKEWRLQHCQVASAVTMNYSRKNVFLTTFPTLLWFLCERSFQWALCFSTSNTSFVYTQAVPYTPQQRRVGVGGGCCTHSVVPVERATPRKQAHCSDDHSRCAILWATFSNALLMVFNNYSAQIKPDQPASALLRRHQRFPVLCPRRHLVILPSLSPVPTLSWAEGA